MEEKKNRGERRRTGKKRVGGVGSFGGREKKETERKGEENKKKTKGMGGTKKKKRGFSELQKRWLQIPTFQKIPDVITVAGGELLTAEEHEE